MTDIQYAACQKLKASGFMYCGKKKSKASDIRLSRWRKDYMFEGVAIGHVTVLVNEDGLPATSSGNVVYPSLREYEEGLAYVAELHPMAIDEAICEMNAEFDADMKAAFFKEE